MNEYYSNSKPFLTNNNTIKQFEHILLPKKTLYDNSVQNILGGFYNSYISPNIFFLILLGILVIFLFIRYFFIDDQEDFLMDLSIDQDINKINFRPTLNPSLPLETQNSYVNYLPDTITEIDPTTGKWINRNDIDPPVYPKEQYPPFIYPSTQKDVFVGTHNTYQNKKDPLYGTNYISNNPYDGEQLAMDSINPSPYNWPTNFNSTTGTAVGWMTKKNRESVSDMDLQQLIGDYELSNSNIIYKAPSCSDMYDNIGAFPQKATKPYAE